ncbi:MAG: hypothetical protein IKC47_02530 [Clostridia bacterium]|nr:hypothetical protein [Clostridia bacterium]
MKKLLSLLVAMLIATSAFLLVGCQATNAYKEVEAIIDAQGQRVDFNYQSTVLGNQQVSLYCDNKLIMQIYVGDNPLHMKIDARGDHVSYAYHDKTANSYVVLERDDDMEVERIRVYEVTANNDYVKLDRTHANYQQFYDTAMQNFAECDVIFCDVIAQLTNGKYTSLRPFLDD